MIRGAAGRVRPLRGCASLRHCALLVAGAALGCAPEAPRPSWCATPSEADVVRLLPTDPGEPLALREVWAVGADDGGHVFGDPRRASVSARGDVAVVDAMTRSVVVIDSAGEWLGPAVRRGEGPGEVEWPVDVEWGRGDRLHVFDLADGTVITRGRSGPDGDTEWSVDRDVYMRIVQAGSLPGADLVGDGSLLLQMPLEPVEGARSLRRAVTLQVFPHRVDTLGRQDVEVLGEGPYAEWPVPGGPQPLMAGGRDGRVVLAGEDPHYRVRVRADSPRGRAWTVLCRETATSPYSPAERGRSVSMPGDEGLAAALRGRDLPADPARLGGVFPGAGDRVWVLRNRPDPRAPSRPAEGGTYDVVAPSEGLLGTVEAPDGVVLVGEGGGKVYGLRRGTLDQVELVAYRLAPPSTGRAPSSTGLPATNFDVGALAGRPEESFGWITDVEVDPSGVVYVLDAQSRQVRAFDGEGSYRGLVAGPGEGPGELGFPTDLAPGRGGAVEILDPARRRIDVFSASDTGTALRESVAIPVSGMALCRVGDRRILHASGAPGGKILHVLGDGGEVGASFGAPYEEELPESLARYRTALMESYNRGRIACSSSGVVVVLQEQVPLVRAFDLGGVPLWEHPIPGYRRVRHRPNPRGGVSPVPDAGDGPVYFGAGVAVVPPDLVAVSVREERAPDSVSYRVLFLSLPDGTEVARGEAPAPILTVRGDHAFGAMELPFPRVLGFSWRAVLEGARRE